MFMYVVLVQKDKLKKKGGCEKKMVSSSLCFCGYFCIVGGAACLASIASPSWFEVHASSSHMRTGVLHSCTTTASLVPFSQEERCGTVSFPDSLCGISSSEILARHAICAALGLGAALLLFILGAVVLIVHVSIQKRGVQIALLFGVLALSMQLIVMILFSQTYKSWYNCGLDWCTYLLEKKGEQGSCVSFLGFSFFLAILGALHTAGVLVMLLVVMWLLRDEDNDVTAAKGGAGNDLRASESYSAEMTKRALLRRMTNTNEPFDDSIVASTSGTHNNKPTRRLPPDNSSFTNVGDDHLLSLSGSAAGGFPPPVPHVAVPRAEVGWIRPDKELRCWPADWVFHSQCKLYWSESEQLYLDPVSQHYYDPHSLKWYDSMREYWYE